MANDEQILPDDMTPKMEHFCQLRAQSMGAAEAARQAGYTSKAAPYQLMANPKVRARILELIKLHCSACCISIESVLLNLERERELAEAKGDIASSIRASELEGKYLAMFSDKLIYDRLNDGEQGRELTEKEQAEAKRIARVLLESLEPTTIKLHGNIA